MPKRPSATLPLFDQTASQLDELFELAWPDQVRYPLNRTKEVSVSAVVDKDLCAAEQPLIVTGYAALDRIVNLVPKLKANASIRLLFGTEPYLVKRAKYEIAEKPFVREIESFWLEQGISLYLSASIVQTLDLLREGRIEARTLGTARRRLHAKIYCTEDAATVGSSNYTRPGMDAQHEANVRFAAATDRRKYGDLCQIAENFWAMGEDFTERLRVLLEKLLKIVTWEEALARACAELLEGEWSDAVVRAQYFNDAGSLWPSQRQGIAQALYVLARHGSVLIADATGSGKTRMGVALMGAISDHNLRSGRLRSGKSLLVCPPLVIPQWGKESNEAGVPLDIHSHGVLSRDTGSRHELTLDALRRAQFLSVDEGHNFLNVKSARTQKLLRNIADAVVVYTATPINRSVVDLLRIADVLGADNLEPSTLKMFRRLMKMRRLNRTLSKEEAEALQNEIRRFTVRRTKGVLNQLISREPDKYLDKRGVRCRFPKHIAEIYSLKESTEDRARAKRIRELAGKLRAVTHFRKTIELPEILKTRGVTEKAYLEGRLSSAKKLAKYIITKSLRSSRAALVEHIIGSAAAIKEFGINNAHKEGATGNMIGRLERIGGQLPTSRLKIPLPDWLTDQDAHRKACLEESETYKEILDLARKLSDGREEAKAQLLYELHQKNLALLAFDSHPISLAVLKKHIQEINPQVPVLVGAGGNAARQAILEAFASDAMKVSVLGLCSDSLSEGVNLQRASTLVHLDMPSVVRVAEQRVGRIDRLDSPHTEIRAWWPDDAPEFALSSDERFIERYDTVEALLGSNMPLPEELRAEKADEPVSTTAIIEDIERESESGSWDGVRDAFESVRSLVSGATSLVKPEIYDHYRNVNARIVSRVSLVKSESSWAFFCLAGGEYGAPRWLLMPGYESQPITDLDVVSEELRKRLRPETENLKIDSTTVKHLEKYLGQLSTAEKELLPARKRRRSKSSKLRSHAW